MLRKLLLTGGLVLAADGTSAQFLIAQIISLLYLVLVIRTLPYEMDTDDILQSLASVSILFTLMTGFALKTEQEKESLMTGTGNDSESIYNKQILGFVLCGINGFVFVFAIATLAAIIGPACRDCKKNLVRRKLKQAEDRKKQEGLKKKFKGRNLKKEKSIRDGKVGGGGGGKKINKKKSTKVKPTTPKTKSKARSPSTTKRTTAAKKGTSSAAQCSKSGVTEKPNRSSRRGGEDRGGRGGRRKK